MSLLVERSFGELIKDSFRIYQRNYIPILLIYILPIFPFQIWNSYATYISMQPVQAVISYIIQFLVSVFLLAPMTIAVSDICLGNKPSVKRVYTTVFARLLGRFIWTYIILLLVILAGFALLLVPGIFFSMYYQLVVTVVVLEGMSGMVALKRSKELGKGFYMRNSLVAFMPFFITMIVIIAVSVIVGLVFAPLLKEEWQLFIPYTFGLMIGDLLAPIHLIVGVLIYYDMRVRTEAYDTTMLSQEMMR